MSAIAWKSLSPFPISLKRDAYLLQCRRVSTEIFYIGNSKKKINKIKGKLLRDCWCVLRQAKKNKIKKSWAFNVLFFFFILLLHVCLSDTFPRILFYLLTRIAVNCLESIRFEIFNQSCLFSLDGIFFSSLFVFVFTFVIEWNLEIVFCLGRWVALIIRH